MTEDNKRCYNCQHFRPYKNGFTGRCADTKPMIKVNAVDYCGMFKAREVL